jgi:steroid 5-alpha reductase family enzyme
MKRASTAKNEQKASATAHRAIFIIQVLMAVFIILPLLLAWLAGAFSF